MVARKYSHLRFVFEIAICIVSLRVYVRCMPIDLSTITLKWIGMQSVWTIRWLAIGALLPILRIRPWVAPVIVVAIHFDIHQAQSSRNGFHCGRCCLANNDGICMMETHYFIIVLILSENHWNGNFCTFSISSFSPAESITEQPKGRRL